MKYFPLKTVLLCILLTPLLYTGTLTGLEKYLSNLYQGRVENHIIGDSQPLLDGVVKIHTAVADNIQKLIKADRFVHLFRLKPDILVTTQGGRVIYPFFEGLQPSFEELQPDMTKEDNHWNSAEIARNNYEILNHGLTVKAVVLLRHGSFAANLILGSYMGISLVVFLIFYRKGSRKAGRDSAVTEQKIESLLKYKQESNEELEELKQQREVQSQRLKQVKSDYQADSRRFNITEEEMFDEILELEKKLENTMMLQNEKKSEVESLKEQLEKEERRKGGGKKRKFFDLAEKRIAALYKNVDMSRRAMAGLFDLNDDMQIKAEEVIHQLNEDSSAVTVKRKVFAGKKNKTASFEVLFAYNGRLYFRNIEGGRIEVLIVGTKNSQVKDMEFLHSI